MCTGSIFGPLKHRAPGALYAGSAVTAGALYSASWDNTTIAWAPKTGQKLRVFTGHLDRISCLQPTTTGGGAAPVEGPLYTGSYDRTVRSWNPDGDLGTVFRGHGKEINWLQVDARHKRLATGSRDGTIRVWELPDWQHEDGEEGTGQVVFVLRGHSGSAVAGSGGVYCGALVNCALYTAGANGQLLQWDLQEGGSVYGCGYGTSLSTRTRAHRSTRVHGAWHCHSARIAHRAVCLCRCRASPTPCASHGRTCPRQAPCSASSWGTGQDGWWRWQLSRCDWSWTRARWAWTSSRRCAESSTSTQAARESCWSAA
jgi:hypothetical protein